MHKSLMVFLFYFVVNPANPQAVFVDFEAGGTTTHLDEVEVVNLESGHRISVFNGEILRLSAEGDVARADYPEAISLTADVAAGGCHIQFSTNRPGFVFLRITDAMGRLVVDEDRELPRGQHQIHVSALKKGAHKVHVMTARNEHTHWIMSDHKFPSDEVEVKWTMAPVSHGPSGKLPVDLTFVGGDRLLLKGMAGEKVHLVALAPERDTVVVFRFVPCVDGDEQHYATVEIGGELWMAENLRTTRLTSGEVLPQIQGTTQWRDAVIPAYCWYQNNDHHQYQYGALYNWYAASDERLCPSGWRMPSDEDWLTLEKEMDPSIDVTSATGWRGIDGALKMKTQRGWDSQNGKNQFGFSALPGGRRSNEGHFNSLGAYAYWWTVSATDDLTAWSRYILPDYEYLYRGSFSKNYGFSVRCIYGGD